MERLRPIVTEEFGSLDHGRHLISPTNASSEEHVVKSEERVDEIEKSVDEIEVLRRALMSSMIIEVGKTEVTIVTEESGSLDDGHGLISPTSASCDVRVDESEKNVAKIEDLRRALMSSMSIEVGDTEVTIATEESGSLDDGHHLISPTSTSCDVRVDESEKNVAKIEENVDESEELQRALIIEVDDTEVTSVTEESGSGSKRLPSPKAVAPGPVLLHSTLKEPSSSQSSPNAVKCDAADADVLILSTLTELPSSQSNPTLVECDAADEDALTLSILKEPSSLQSNPAVVEYDIADEDVLNLSTMKTQIERAMNENDGDYEIVCTVSQLKEYTDAEKAKVVQEISETQAHGVLHGLADRFKISRMQDVKSTADVAYYRLHNQTKELDPATRRGKIFVHERSAELSLVLQDVKEEMHVPIVKALAKRYGLVAAEKVFKTATPSGKIGAR
jgi:hypothetical protein